MGSNGIAVNGGNTSLQYVSSNSSNPMQGMIRVNGIDMQVFDGNGWSNIQTSYATVELDAETRLLLEWARKKRDEEILLESMAKEHPAVKIAYDHFQKSRQQLEVTVKLSQDTTDKIQWHPV